MACRPPEGAAGALRVARAFPLALVGLAAAIAGFGALAEPAAAGQLPTAREQVAVLRAEALHVAVQVHQWTARFQDDTARAAYLGREAGAAQATLTSLHSRLAGTTSLLQQEAVLAYAGVAPASSASVLPEADMAGVFQREAYEKIAIGDLSQTLNRFQSEESALSYTLTGYNRGLAADRTAMRSAAAARDRALSRAAALQAFLSRAQAHLAALQAASASPTGLPVGDGIVKAVAAQLQAAGAPTGPAAPAVVTVAHANARAEARVHGAAATTAVPATTATPTTRRAVSVPTTTSSVPARTTSGATTTATTADPPATPSSTAATTPVPATSVPTTATTVPSTTVPSTTVPSTSRPSTTVPSTSRPSTSRPSTSRPSTSRPSTTVPATTTTTTTTTVPTTTTTAAPAATSAPAGSEASAAGAHPPPAGGAWLELRECESGDNYQEDTGNGYYGAYQFSWTTWSDLGYPGRPDLEPYWMQDAAAQHLQALYGWGQWPACSAALGL